MIKPYETMPTVIRIIGIISTAVFMYLLGTFIGHFFGITIQILGGVVGSVFGGFLSIIMFNINDYLFHMAMKGK